MDTDQPGWWVCLPPGCQVLGQRGQAALGLRALWPPRGDRHAGRSCPSETQTEVHQATRLLPALRHGGTEGLDLAQLGHETLIFQADRWGAESRREGKDQPAIFYVTLTKARLKVKEEP